MPAHQQPPNPPHSLDSRLSEAPGVYPGAFPDLPEPLVTDEIRGISPDQAPPRQNAKGGGDGNEDNDPRKCWICFSDETEDTPQTTRWVSPCACSLCAHEGCILDWLADLENTSSGRSRRGGSGSLSGNNLLCPQCRSEIVIARPHSWVVDGMRRLDALVDGPVAVAGVGLTIAGSILAGCCGHGLQAIYVTLGREHANRLMASLYNDSVNFFDRSPAASNRMSLQRATRLNLGIPMIPIALVIARTKFADSILPILTVLFMAPELQQDLKNRGANPLRWPPTAAMTFSALPYVGALYRIAWERLFGSTERRWLEEVKPSLTKESERERARQQNRENQANNNNERQGRGAANNVNNNNDDDNNEDPFDIMRVNLQIQFTLHDAEDEDENQGDIEREIEAPNQENAEGQQAAPAPNVPHNDNAAANVDGEEINISNLIDTVLGALIFPSIAAGMGEIMRLVLPTSLTSPHGSSPSSTASTASTLGLQLFRGLGFGFGGEGGKPSNGGSSSPGFLSTRWGRSVAGGCIFVVLKDALRLYCRWRQVQAHRNRKVLNYDRRLRRVVK